MGWAFFVMFWFIYGSHDPRRARRKEVVLG